LRAVGGAGLSDLAPVESAATLVEGIDTPEPFGQAAKRRTSDMGTDALR